MYSQLPMCSFGTAAKLYNPLKRVVVIGGGVMGSGIAQVNAQAGHQVTLVDQTNEILNSSLIGISKSLERVGKKKFSYDTKATLKWMSETLDNIKFSTQAIEASLTADLIIECIVEDLNVKKILFQELDKTVPSTAIFASNTSSFLIRSLAEQTNRKDRFAGLHFFNPVPMMKLVEIVKTPDLSDTTVKSLQEYVKSIGHIFVKCNDTPGFIVNRLLIPYIIEAIKMAERGDATKEDIDMAMKLGCGQPMGPIELADLAGLDVLKNITEGWVEDYPEISQFQTSKVVKQKVEEGFFGRKTGKGFYKY